MPKVNAQIPFNERDYFSRLKAFYPFLKFASLIFVLGIYVALNAFISIIPWLLGLGFIYLFSRQYENRVPGSIKMTHLVIISYLIISLFGLIKVFDNFNNFGVYFGKAGDDSKFFYNALQLIQGKKPIEYGLYEIVLFYFSRFLMLFYPGSLELIDLLPINWAFSALCVGLSSQLAFTITGKKCPVFLLLAALIGNHMFVDSTIHLYRDVLLLFFILLALLLTLHHKIITTLGSIVIVSLLRGANGMISLFFLGVFHFRSMIKSLKLFYLTTILTGCIIGIFLIKSQSFNILFISTYYPKITRYVTVFENYNMQEYLYYRNISLSKAHSEGSLTGKAYQSGGPVGIILKVAITMFFPFSLYSPYASTEVHSLYGTISYVYKGFFIYNIISWLMVLCWLVVIPLLSIGIWRAFIGDRIQNSIIVYYIVSVLLVALISGQIRHATCFIIIHPTLVSLGYMYCQKNVKARMIRNFLFLAVFVIIMGFNIMGMLS